MFDTIYTAGLPFAIGEFYHAFPLSIAQKVALSRKEIPAFAGMEVFLTACRISPSGFFGEGDAADD